MFSPNTSVPSGIATCTTLDPNCGAPFKTSTALALEGDFAHRFLNLHLASLSLEFPIVGVSNRDTEHTLLNPGTLNSTESYSQIFFTPSVKLKVALPLISPFVSAGGGFSHFGSVKLSSGASVGGSTKGALQFGGGVDLGTPIPHLGLRGEVREFYTARPDFSSSQHNLLVGAGAVLRF